MQLCRGCTCTLEGRELRSGLDEDNMTPMGMGSALYTSIGARTRREYSAHQQWMPYGESAANLQ